MKATNTVHVLSHRSGRPPFVGGLPRALFLMCLMAALARGDDITHDFSIVGGSVIFDTNSTTTSLTASNLSLNVATRYFGSFLECAAGCAPGSHPFTSGLSYELARGDAVYDGRTNFVSQIDSFRFNGSVDIPDTKAAQITVQGRFTFSGSFKFYYFSDLVTANLRGQGVGTWVLNQTQPGLFVSTGPHRFDFEPITDSDGDGVLDDQDQCPDSPSGAIVDGEGCSLDQLVPCTGPRLGGTWKNHGEYVFSVVRAAEDFLAQGLIDAGQKDALVAAAAKSQCGK